MIKEIAGLTDLLKSLKAADVRCAAASNSPKGNVDMVLDELDLRRYFDVVIDRDQISHGKPNPEMLLATAERLGLDAKRCIVVEDSLSGFAAAERAGMKYIVITAGADAEELKHAANACAMYEDFTAITAQRLTDFL